MTNSYVYQGPTGFYRWQMRHGLPYLEYFYLKTTYRSFSNSRGFFKLASAFIQGLGFTKFIVAIPQHKKRMLRLVSKYFRTVPYAVADGHHFFLLEVK